MPAMPFPRPATLAATLALALSPAHAAAQQRDTPTELDDVVVTATRTAVTVDASLAAVEVIDRAQIERSVARSLPELLRARAGLTLVNQGGLGKVSTAFLRGAESDHVIVLLDGVRVGSSTSGLAALQDIPLELLERIEIVRGPRSSLYGADAIGGVIQLFTRRDGATGLRPRAKLGMGSDALREASLGLDARGAHGGIGIDVGHQSSDGFDACRGIGAPRYAGCGMDAPDPDRDGYRNTHAALRADLAAGDAMRLDLHAMRARGHNEYDADPAWGLPDNSRVLQQVVGGNLRLDLGDAAALKLTLGRNRDDSDNRLGNAFASRFLAIRDSAGVQADIAPAAGQLLSVGVDWLRDRAQVTDPFVPFDAARGNRAAFAQYQARLGAHDLQASLRHDDNDQFGGHATGAIAWGLGLGRGWRVVASHGAAFKAPSFNELYYPFYGNPTLRPETSRSSEFGIARRLGALHWALNAYQTRIVDLIGYDTTLFAANNIERARIRGLELVGGGSLGGWDWQGQWTALDARNASPGAGAGKRLPRRPQQTARIDLDRALAGTLSVGVSGIAEGARWDDMANTLRVGGHATLDARMTWSFVPDWSLQASLLNAFDQRYETSAYYRQPGRGFALALRWQPR